MRGKKTILLALTAIVLTVGAVWFIQRPVPQKEVTWQDVLTEAKNGGYQITTTEELWKQYQKNPEHLLLVDTRQEWEYGTGHIKGAINFSFEPTWWSMWRKKSALKALLGPDKNRLIVFY